MRIVQYNTDLDGSFKAHIKVDHAGKSPSTLQEIDIPADEMKSLVNKMRNTDDETEEIEPEVDGVKKSKSYVLGPPKKMSEIIMEQAAAIREIISKEIEAEQKREAEENRTKIQSIVDIDEEVESPVVRVALSPTKNSESQNPIKKAEASEEAASAPVKNISFKNRITFYKPTEGIEKVEKNVTEKILPEAETDGELKSETKDDIILHSPDQKE